MKGVSRLLHSDSCRSVSHQGTTLNLLVELNYFYAQTLLLVGAEGLGEVERDGEGAAFKMSYSSGTLGVCFGSLTALLCQVESAHVRARMWAFPPR